jgi:mannosyltransferase OCH1-like enzyme
MQNGLNKRVLWKKVLFFILLLPAIVIVFLILKNSTYLISEFILVPNNTSQFEQCDKMESIGQKRIPKIIHQVHGFKDLQMNTDHLDKIKTWKEQHSDYIYYLWNATTVNRLIQNEYKHLFHLFTSYGSWIQRADVARYVILHYYGGWYIDLDVRCKAG